MKKICIVAISCLLSYGHSVSQVKSNYLYNTSMPYGTLDIRTTISSSAYYYLLENRTFSFRQSSPGVRTNTYLDMTSTWDSSPYKQGHMRFKNGTADKFVMNYRLLFPLNYNATYTEGYPMIVMFHGAVERANCYYNSCYHSNWSYDPNVNSPPAPTTSTHRLLNNDHNLSQGGKTHLDARNLAAGKLPNDPTVTGRQFPGFVLVPQMFNEWNSLNVQDFIRLVQLVARKYNVDDNRIYIHGLSIGGYATYEALKRAAWLFAAALPMSAVSDAGIFTHNQQGKVVHIPLWVFQGGQDTAPSPSYTGGLVTKFRNAGAIVRYTVYSDVGHTCWHKAFAEKEFFSWMLTKTKSNIHPSKGITAINTATGQYPTLMLAEGFFAYQWQKDGVTITGATSNIYVARSPGTYRARFSRVANPTSTQWNKWSAPLVITGGSTSARVAATSEEAEPGAGEANEFDILSYPNPATGEDLTITITTPDHNIPVHVRMFDAVGRPVLNLIDTPERLAEGIRPDMQTSNTNGMYVIIASQGQQTVRRKILINR
jgi:hypothetical protein